MSSVLVKEKEVVVPGQEIAEGMDYLPGYGTYRLDEKILAGRVGLVHVSGRAMNIIPLSGRYLPKTEDTIIAKVVDITMNGWILETNSAYNSMLSMRDATSSFIEKGADLTQFFAIGDLVVATIIRVTSQKLIDLTTKGPGLRKLTGGQIIKVNPYKVPRIIGKQGSMVSVVKNATGCRIIVGQNGLIWIHGEPAQEVRAINAIAKIEEEAHLPGLTERIKIFLEGGAQ